MQSFYEPIPPDSPHPHILGLTASPILGSRIGPEQFKDLERLFHASVYFPFKYHSVLRRFAPLPAEVILEYPETIRFFIFFSFS